MLSQSIINGINKGLPLKDISTSLGFCPGYISNLLKKEKNLIDSDLIKKIATNKRERLAKVNQKHVPDDYITDIKNGLSSAQISRKYNCSSVHIKNYTKKYHAECYNELISNGLRRRDTIALGKPNLHWKNNAGKTYEDIYGVDKAKEMRQKRSKWLKENNIRKFNTKISKPQKMLFDIVKEQYPTAVIEHKICTPSKNFYLDIAIVDRKINIEYDGNYWHRKNSEAGLFSDALRDQKLISMGWNIYRIKFDANPTEKMLRDALLEQNIL